MISLDQVQLLEQKVESAVAKIAQLNAENAALRSKCAELTNALSAKSEQFSSFQQDQNKIEEGILKALDRLNNVESSVLESEKSTHTAPTQPAKAPAQEQNQAAVAQSQNIHKTFSANTTQNFKSANDTPAHSAQTNTTQQSISNQPASSVSGSQAAIDANQTASSDTPSKNQGQFDIF